MNQDAGLRSGGVALAARGYFLMQLRIPADVAEMSVRSSIVWVVRIAGTVFVADLIADRRGFTMFDPYFFIPFACLSVIFVAPVVTFTAAGFARVLLPALAMPAAMLACALLLLNLAAPPGIWAFPPPGLVFEATVASLLATAAGAVLKRQLGARLSPKLVQWAFRCAALGGIVAWRYWPS